MLRVFGLILACEFTMLPSTASAAEYKDHLPGSDKSNLPVHAISGPYETVPPVEIIRENLYSPHDVVEIYLQAIRRGELRLFNRPLDESMLTVLRVEYIYEIQCDKTSKKVYSELKHPMDIPNQDCCKVRGVSAILDEHGHIIETEIHIWDKQ